MQHHKIIFWDSLHRFLTQHTDDIAAFAGGSGVTLWGWMHLDPGVIVGKVATTFILGFVGGMAGITAKWVCNSFTKSRKRKPKPPQPK